MTPPESGSTTPARRLWTLGGVLATVVSFGLVGYSLVTDPMWDNVTTVASDVSAPSPSVQEQGRPTAGQLASVADVVLRDGGPWLESVYVDERQSVVVATALEDNRPSLSDALYGLDHVSVNTAAGKVMAASGPAGGTGIVAGKRACSLGFNARKGSTPVFLTAGHCAEGYPSFRMGGTYLGKTAGVDFPTKDYAYVKTNASLAGRGVVRRGTSLVAVKGSSVAPVGARVCKSGAATGWSCGNVLARNVTVRLWLSATRSVFVKGLTKTSACSVRGDSGGPWLWGSQAQGLTSGAVTYAGKCGSAVGRPQISYFQPIRPALSAYGLTLATS